MKRLLALVLKYVYFTLRYDTLATTQNLKEDSRVVMGCNVGLYLSILLY
jgi:hypothetical protein